MRKTKFILCLALILSGGLFGCSTAIKHPSDLPLRYYNEQYGFTFFLPERWKGYSVLIQQWDSETYFPATDKMVVTEHGQTIILRHPQWKASDPYQDVPIVVFTRSQWDSLNHGNLWPSI